MQTSFYQGVIALDLFVAGIDIGLGIYGIALACLACACALWLLLRSKSR